MADHPQPEKSREVNILWNGGWDKYLVDPSSVRSMTAEEAEYFSRNKYWTTTRIGCVDWLRCGFIHSSHGIGDKTMLVRIRKHLGGGD